LSDAPRTATVTAVDYAMLFEISKELIADITSQYPQVGEVMKRFHKNRLLTNLLKTSPIFQPFSTSDKKLLIEKFKSRHVADGVYLITRERPGDGLYVLLSGRCEVTDVDDQGRDVALAELKDGDVFGEMSMLWNQETCASVRTVSPCIVLRLPRASFQELIMTHPQILETLTSLSERRAQQNAAITGTVMAAPA
jgi:cAMP-dependent protein kinase regulator